MVSRIHGHQDIACEKVGSLAWKRKENDIEKQHTNPCPHLFQLPLFGPPLRPLVDEDARRAKLSAEAAMRTDSVAPRLSPSARFTCEPGLLPGGCCVHGVGN